MRDGMQHIIKGQGKYAQIAMSRLADVRMILYITSPVIRFVKNATTKS
jgi:hypothetical protein